MIKAIIFDLDGTLVDTIPIYMAAYIKVINEELGLPIAKEQIEAKFGKKATNIMLELLEDAGMHPSETEVAELIDKIREDFKKNFMKVLVLPGVFELLERLKKEGYKIALATSSRNYAADLILKKFELRKYFDAVVTGDDIVHSKPHPEIFLKAAEELGVEPEDCLVVEDAVYGIDAGKAAKMKTLAVRTGGYSDGKLEDCGADWIIDDLNKFDYGILN
jgi:beta-phosphoglucomutase